MRFQNPLALTKLHYAYSFNFWGEGVVWDEGSVVE